MPWVQASCIVTGKVVTDQFPAINTSKLLDEDGDQTWPGSQLPLYGKACGYASSLPICTVNYKNSVSNSRAARTSYSPNRGGGNAVKTASRPSRNTRGLYSLSTCNLADERIASQAAGSS